MEGNKSELRQRFLNKRKSLTLSEIEDKSRQITTNLLSKIELRNLSYLHIFLPQQRSNEVATWKIIDEIRASFPTLKIVSPYVVPGQKIMKSYLLSDPSKLIDNQWGIPEPDPTICEEIGPHLIDAVILPLLTFDKQGYRVGYGGGFYDRFLAECREDVVKIGVSFFKPVDKIIDTNKFDISMNYCVTPEYIYTFIEKF